MERMLVADGLKKSIGFFAEYAKLVDADPTGEGEDAEEDSFIAQARTSYLNSASERDNATDFESAGPRVEQIISGSVPALTAWPGAGDIIYGFLNGIVNVFPRYSLP